MDRRKTFMVKLKNFEESIEGISKPVTMIQRKISINHHASGARYFYTLANGPCEDHWILICCCLTLFLNFFLTINLKISDLTRGRRAVTILLQRPFKSFSYNFLILKFSYTYCKFLKLLTLFDDKILLQSNARVGQICLTSRG